MKCCLLPKVLLSKSKECACNIFLPSVWKETNLMGCKQKKILANRNAIFSLCETSCTAQFKPDVTSLFVGWSIYEKFLKNSGVFCPAPGSLQNNNVKWPNSGFCVKLLPALTDNCLHWQFIFRILRCVAYLIFETILTKIHCLLLNDYRLSQDS